MEALVENWVDREPRAGSGRSDGIKLGIRAAAHTIRAREKPLGTE